MPHKVTVVDLLDEASTAVKIAGSCNAVRRDDQGRLLGDMFDGEGFVRGVRRKGVVLDGASVLVIGSGGVGSAIAASMAAAGVARLGLFDVHAPNAVGLAQRLKQHYPRLDLQTGSNDPAGFDVLVNATPLGMNVGDPLPVDMARVAPTTFVGEVVMKSETTAFLQAAQARGCRVPDRHRHAVRADSRLPGVLRLRHHHAGRPARGRCSQLLMRAGIASARLRSASVPCSRPQALPLPDPLP